MKIGYGTGAYQKTLVEVIKMAAITGTKPLI